MAADHLPDANDLRLMLSDETWAALKTEAKLTGKHPRAIAADWLHERAMQGVHRANVLQGFLKVKGIALAEAGRARLDADAAGWADTQGQA